jgi:hypothetical protein
MRLCQLDLPVPDHTHMSRRAAQLSVKIPRRPRKGPTHVVVDSTGLKIFGEGEWKVRQHGVGKRRTWRKIHLAVDETSKDIIGIEVTTTAWGDSEILPGLLDQVEGDRLAGLGRWRLRQPRLPRGDCRAGRACHHPAPRWSGCVGRRPPPRRHPPGNRSQGTRRLEERQRLPPAQHRREHDVPAEATGRQPVLPNLRAASDRSSRSRRHPQHVYLPGHAAF